MESDSRNFSYGGSSEPSNSSRMNRSMDGSSTDQFVAILQHSTLTQPRMATGGVNPLDLTSAIQHELRRVNSQPGSWAPHWSQQSGGSLSHAASLDAASGFPIPSGSFLDGPGNHHHQPQQTIPQYIPRFDEAGLGPALQQMPTRFDFTSETGSARHPLGFYSRSANELPPSHSPAQHQVFETTVQRGDSMRSCSPWIERMTQADVTPTPSPINLCLSSSLSLRDVSCVASQTVDLQSFSSDPQHESTVELSADLCTDDDDLETRPMDVKRKKRMLSNRASAQRSRQRRQERLDQLEVLTAKLRVENSTLQKKLNAAIQVAKKFDDQNKDLLKKVDRLSKELELGGGSSNKKARKPIAGTNHNNFKDSASSQQTACASSCEMVGEQLGVDPNVMRDGNMNDGGSTTPSMSPSSPGWPSGTSPPENEREADVVSTGNGAQISPVRKSFSACRMERKRPYDQSEHAGAFGKSPMDNRQMHGSSASHGHPTNRPRSSGPPLTGMGGGSPEPRHFWHEVCNPLGLDAKDDSVNVDCLEADRWLEFTECFL